MIAVDTNLLVYAADSDSPWQSRAESLLVELAEGQAPWALVWPCIHEFLGVITNPRIYKNKALPTAKAFDHAERWMESPSVRLIGESAGYWLRLRHLMEEGKIVGPMVHDAKIASICLHHGVDVLWSADRDFLRFPQLKTINPLVKR